MAASSLIYVDVEVTEKTVTVKIMTGEYFNDRKNIRNTLAPCDFAALISVPVPILVPIPVHIPVPIPVPITCSHSCSHPRSHSCSHHPFSSPFPFPFPSPFPSPALIPVSIPVAIPVPTTHSHSCSDPSFPYMLPIRSAPPRTHVHGDARGLVNDDLVGAGRAVLEELL